MMAKMMTANRRRRAMFTRGPMAFPIELITTWRPESQKENEKKFCFRI
jgi:hypothetical protein